MVKIIYAQNYQYNSKQTSSRHFYVRTHSLKESDSLKKSGWSGEWHLPERATFSAYRLDYFSRPHSIEFWICSVSEKFEEDRISIYPSGNVASVQGKFQIIAHSNSRTYAHRLMDWWEEGDGSIEYAKLCAKYLKPRVKEIPAEEIEKLKPHPQPTDAVLGGDTAFQKWLSTAAVLGGKKVL